MKIIRKTIIKPDWKLLLLQMYVPTNPRGAESLPAGIVVSESDLYLRRLWGEPSEVWSVIVVYYTIKVV